ncbi:MAG TPA: DUF1501 domain-containing protein [Planctomycetaceae bacterium]|nr:DUF1501 domain-containing protein [Planctomycetaceae bacterium]
MLRRDFLQASAGTLAFRASRLSATESNETAAVPLGKAEHCVVIWLGGGAGQMDTWDPKALGDPQTKKPGSYYPAIDTAVAGTQVCQHLRRCAPLMDRFNLIRTVHHDVIDEHASAVNRLHTGRPVSETVTYPSLGSVIVNQRGPAGDGVPPYVLIGYPSATRGPGFLGAKCGYVYLTDTASGPAGLSRPPEISAERQIRREELLAKVRSERTANAITKNYDAMISEALRYGKPEFQKIFHLDTEPADLRNGYGGEFGQRCLLTRRLLQSGVRTVEVAHNLNFLNGTGWDVHNEGILNQFKLIEELDQALSAFLLDLERNKLLDKTLVVVATEFGRPAGFDGGGGRGHHGKCFSIALAGGGLKNGRTIGLTDDLSMQIVERPVSVPDLHATIYAALGINPKENLYAGDRPIPITDGGTPIAELFV